MKASFHVSTLMLGCFALPCCGHQSAEDRQLASLQEDVTRMQEGRDRMDQRLGLLEVQAADGRNKESPRHKTPPIPPQRTIAVDPDGSEHAQSSTEAASELDGEDTEDTTPKPTIRVAGSVGRHGARGPEHIEETLPEDAPNGGAAGPAVHSDVPRASAFDPEARRAYDAALALVNARQYDRALEAFAAFLVKWPDHPNADNAMYWRGESYFAKGEFARAAEEFEGTILRFPLGNKVPDALLKLGLCQDRLGNGAKAKSYYTRLQRDFPRSEAARRIPGGDSSRAPGPQESP